MVYLLVILLILLILWLAYRNRRNRPYADNSIDWPDSNLGSSLIVSDSDNIIADSNTTEFGGGEFSGGGADGSWDDAGGDNDIGDIGDAGDAADIDIDFSSD